MQNYTVYPTKTNSRKRRTQAATAYPIRFEVVDDPSRCFVAQLEDTLVLGLAADLPLSSALRDLGGEAAGIADYHVLLNLDADGNIQAVDLSSVSRTLINNTNLGFEGPLLVRDGDIITLGDVRLRMRLMSTLDEGENAPEESEHFWALMTIAKSLTSQLELDYILHHILQFSRTMISAKEMQIWLMDEPTQELYLRAELGIEDESIRHIRLLADDPHVSAVLESGEPLRASRTITGGPVKIKTGYLVEAILYVPLIAGQQKLGVMAAVHRDYDSAFSQADERLLAGLGDFAAIAIQNSLIHEQVQEVNRIKDEMIQNISHEFRTPLQYFRGYISLMLDDRDKLDPAHREYLQVLDQQSDRLRWLITNFISLNDSSRKQASLVPVDLNYVLSSAVHSARPLAGSREITLSYRQDEELPMVLGSLSKLFEVVDNLLGNALKFTPIGGRIEVWGETSEDKHRILVHVKDSGIGVDPSQHQHIFERFYQVDGSANRHHGGVGIGLAVSKSIIEQHNGEIWVESEQGQGSVFTFALPAARQDELDRYA